MAARMTALIAVVLFGLSPLFGDLPLVDRWFALQCSRDPARFWLPFGITPAVCSRCLGLYVGLALGALLGAVAARARPGAGSEPLRRRARRLLGWTVLGALAMLVDVGSEALGLRPAFAELRFASGVLTALPAAALLGIVLCRRADCAAGLELQHSE